MSRMQPRNERIRGFWSLIRSSAQSNAVTPSGRAICWLPTRITCRGFGLMGSPGEEATIVPPCFPSPRPSQRVCDRCGGLPAEALTPPCPLSPTARPTAGREGVGKSKKLLSSFLQSPSSPRVGGCEVGEEGRGGEGLRRAYPPI